jgi:2-C-methyl-D-erythritol 4-phosphate cytidylyltransferase
MGVTACILAAGNGSRFGGQKQFLFVDGVSITRITQRIFEPFVDEMITAYPKDIAWEAIPGDIKGYLAKGGPTRYESFRNCFKHVTPGNMVFVVDAVRCNTSARIIRELLELMNRFDCAFPLYPSTNTVCHMNPFSVVDKNDMFDIQTPVLFKYEAMQTVLGVMVPKDGYSFFSRVGETDLAVGWCKGSDENIKITSPSDLDLYNILREKTEWK